MNCREGNQFIIQQITTLLDSIDNQLYTKSLDVFKGSSIGQHFRHILDFYLCLIKGIDNDMVDYAQRDRNPLAESDVDFTKQAFQEITQTILHFVETQSVTVRGEFSTQALERPELASSVGRELMFAYDHAVHHLAMIRIGMEVAVPEIQLDTNIGIAPSTMKHRNGILISE